MLDTTSNPGWSLLLSFSVIVCLLSDVSGSSLVWILSRQLFVLFLLLLLSSGRESNHVRGSACPLGCSTCMCTRSRALLDVLGLSSALPLRSTGQGGTVSVVAVAAAEASHPS